MLNRVMVGLDEFGQRRQRDSNQMGRHRFIGYIGRNCSHIWAWGLVWLDRWLEEEWGGLTGEDGTEDEEDSCGHMDGGYLDGLRSRTGNREIVKVVHWDSLQETVGGEGG